MGLLRALVHHKAGRAGDRAYLELLRVAVGIEGSGDGGELGFLGREALAEVGTGDGMCVELFGGAVLQGQSAGDGARVQGLGGDGPQQDRAGHGREGKAFPRELAYLNGAAYALYP